MIAVHVLEKKLKPGDGRLVFCVYGGAYNVTVKECEQFFPAAVCFCHIKLISPGWGVNQNVHSCLSSEFAVAHLILCGPEKLVIVYYYYAAVEKCCLVNKPRTRNSQSPN